MFKKLYQVNERIFFWLFALVFKWLCGLKREIWFYKGLDWLIRTCKNRTVLIKGIENLPREGSFIVAANHMGSWNLVFIFGALVAILKRPIFVVVEKRVWQKDEELATRWLAFIKKTEACLITMLKKIKQGEIIGITPAGARDKKINKNTLHLEKILQQAGEGVAVLADYAPVIPVAFQAPDSNCIRQDIWGLIQVLFIKKIPLVIGQPMVFTDHLNQLDREEKRGEIKKRLKIIVKEIYALVDQIKPY